MVVIIVIWIISLLVIYMLFLMCLDPLLNKRVKANYQEHTNEDVNVASIISPYETSINGSADLGVVPPMRHFRDSYRNKYSRNFVPEVGNLLHPHARRSGSGGSADDSDSDVEIISTVLPGDDRESRVRLLS